MNPTTEQRPHAAQAVDPDILSQIIEQYEETARPFGKGDDYSEEDAKALGLPSPAMLNFLNKFVKRMIGTPFVPKWIAESSNPAGTMLACILRGRELDFKAMESLEVFWKAPDGRLTMWAKTMMALMRKSGFKFHWIRDDAEGCEVKGVRPDGDEYVAHFSHEDAITAQLWDKNQSMHKKYPANMNRSRCITMIWNTLAADLGGGPMYSREEVEEELRVSRGDHSDAAFQEQARKNTEAEQSPFVVTEAPKVETPKPVVETKAAEPETTKPVVQPANHVLQAMADPPVQTGPAEPKAEPKRRGKTPTPEAAKEQLKASVDGFKATEDDLPEALQNPTVAKTATVALPQMERIQGIIAHLSEQSKKPADEVKKTVIKPFMTTFLGQSVGHNGPLPAPPNALYEDLLPILESLAEQYSQKLLADPGAVGGVSGTGWKELKEQSEGFSKDLREAVCSVAAQRHPDNPGDLITFMEDVAEFDGKSDPKEVLTFLKVYAITRMVLKLKEASMATGKTMTELVSKLDLGKATEADILAAAKMPEKTGDTGELWDEEGK